MFQQEGYAFRADNGAAPADDAIPNGVGSSAIGTAAGNAGIGAAIGAGAGLLLGGAIGANGACWISLILGVDKNWGSTTFLP